jgi:hypothetical protein
MIFRPLNPFNPSRTSRRVATALLLSAVLALTCAAPSRAWAGFGRPTIGAPERTPPEGGIFRFLLRMLGLTKSTLDTNGTMDPNGHQ